MSALDPNGGGPLVSPGDGGGGTHGSGTLAARPASPAAGDTYAVIAADPSCPGVVFACLAAGLWTIAGSETTTDDFSSGWTAYNGTGSVAISAGALTLTSIAGTQYRIVGYGYNGPCAYRTIASASDFDIAIRLSSVDATDRTAVTLEIASAASGDTGTRYAVQANRTSGDVALYSNSANVEYASAPGRFASWTGQEWIMLSVRGASVAAYSGVGVAGAVPTSWSIVGSTTVSAAWVSAALGVMSIGCATTTHVTAARLVYRCLSTPALPAGAF